MWCQSRMAWTVQKQDVMLKCLALAVLQEGAEGDLHTAYSIKGEHMEHPHRSALTEE